VCGEGKDPVDVKDASLAAPRGGDSRLGNQVIPKFVSERTAECSGLSNSGH
jgi:hypothetical protein